LVALSICTTAHPLHLPRRLTNIFGASISERTMRPHPRHGIRTPYGAGYIGQPSYAPFSKDGRARGGWQRHSVVSFPVPVGILHIHENEARLNDSTALEYRPGVAREHYAVGRERLCGPHRPRHGAGLLMQGVRGSTGPLVALPGPGSPWTLSG
jgi:hypothetical protein